MSTRHLLLEGPVLIVDEYNNTFTIGEVNQQYLIKFISERSSEIPISCGDTYHPLLWEALHDPR